jgi:hypothetical protein
VSNDNNPHTAPRSEAAKPWDIVVVEQEPLRGAARSRCKKAMTRVEKVRGRLSVFEQEDKPAFTRWLAREFGPLLSRAREIDAQIREKQVLLQEVESEISRSFCDAQTAYRRVMDRRANPLSENVSAKNRSDGAAGFATKLSDPEKEIIFQEWLRQYFGVNPENMDATAYGSTFGMFRFHMFGDEPGGSSWDFIGQASIESPSPRMKELYRVLVRRLHPDIRADGDAEAGALWHEVQKAYAARNVERLETLVALTDIESGNLGPQTSLFQIRAVWTELKQALRALRRSLHAALSDDAWNFARSGADETLRTRVEQNLESDLAKKANTLAYLTATIARWADQQPMTGPTGETEHAQFVS